MPLPLKSGVIVGIMVVEIVALAQPTEISPAGDKTQVVTRRKNETLFDIEIVAAIYLMDHRPAIERVGKLHGVRPYKPR